MRRRRGSTGIRDERGFAIVYVLALVAIAMALGAAALADTLSSRQLTTHDQRGRRAQQAAQSGIQSQLYDEAEASVGAAYNFTGGVLGLSTLLDCAVPQFNANLQVAGISAYASSGGVCPQALTSSGSPVTSSAWTPVGNHAYFDAEYLSNKKEISGSGVGAAVYFPEILSIGCDATSAANCKTTSSKNVYARELALFAPTGPLQAIEGTGNVTINGLSVLGLNTAVAVNGDISSGATLALPTVALALNTNFTLNSVPSTSVQATFAYKTETGNLISTANNVQVSGFCSAASPATNCVIKRQPVSITTTTCANCSTGITCASCTGGGYSSSNDTFTLTGGTATFASGDYVFCNFNATGGTIKTNASSTTPVRIFILPPNSAPCNGYTYTAAQETNGTVGNFYASPGINNLLTGTINNVSNTVDPSGLQIYVAGDGSYDNNTTVYVGDGDKCTSVSLLGVCLSAVPSITTEAMVIYAPTSSVNVNLGQCVVGLLGSCTLGTAGAFIGSVIGDNTQVTATAITQDLDLGNYPLYSGTTLLQPVEYVQCDISKTTLGGATSDTGGC
jgi:Tfp pilus assembly protein PilX